MEVISRKEAKELGLKRYFTGNPCKHGHISERKVCDGGCVECSKISSREWKLNNKEKVRKAQRKWFINNKEKAYDSNKRSYLKNREARLVDCSRYREENKEKIASYKKEYNKLNRDKQCEYSKTQGLNMLPITHQNAQKGEPQKSQQRQNGLIS